MENTNPTHNDVIESLILLRVCVDICKLTGIRKKMTQNNVQYVVKSLGERGLNIHRTRIHGVREYRQEIDLKRLT